VVSNIYCCSTSIIAWLVQMERTFFWDSLKQPTRFVGHNDIYISIYIYILYIYKPFILVWYIYIYSIWYVCHDKLDQPPWGMVIATFGGIRRRSGTWMWMKRQNTHWRCTYFFNDIYIPMSIFLQIWIYIYISYQKNKTLVHWTTLNKMIILW
jgi:hypothetical protein